MLKPCAECPFKKKSLRGWLGAAAEGPLDFIRGAMSEDGLPCHMNNDKQCEGAVLMANKSCKSYRNPELRGMQLQGAKDDPNILSVPEFMAHHTLDLKKK